MNLAEALADEYNQMEGEPERWQVEAMYDVCLLLDLNPDMDIEQVRSLLNGP